MGIKMYIRLVQSCKKNLKNLSCCNFLLLILIRLKILVKWNVCENSLKIFLLTIDILEEIHGLFIIKGIKSLIRPFGLI